MSSSEEDVQNIVIVGVDGEGNKLSEVVPMQGQKNAFTQSKYLYIDRVGIESGDANKGGISIHREDGQPVCMIAPRENQATKAEHYATKPARVAGYGVSTQVFAKAEPVNIKLMKVSDGRKYELHGASVDALRSESFEKQFIGDLRLAPGEYVGVYAYTLGSDIPITGWLEVIEDEV